MYMSFEEFVQCVITEIFLLDKNTIKKISFFIDSNCPLYTSNLISLVFNLDNSFTHIKKETNKLVKITGYNNTIYNIKFQILYYNDEKYEIFYRVFNDDNDEGILKSQFVLTRVCQVIKFKYYKDRLIIEYSYNYEQYLKDIENITYDDLKTILNLRWDELYDNDLKLDEDDD